MASKATAQAVRGLARSTRPSCVCQRSTFVLPTSISRSFSSTPRAADGEPIESERPRWLETPKGMKAPFSLNNPKKMIKVNEDAEVLDAAYLRFLGHGGDKLLPEEIKWVAVTHKSFDCGRRGFNDRLAFYGKRFVTMQATEALLNSNVGSSSSTEPDQYGRVPYEDPALKRLANLNKVDVAQALSPKRVARLASGMGLAQVVRWVPKDPDRLTYSGLDLVLNMSVYAIIGAVALQHGGAVAARLTRERILAPLGLIQEA